MQCVCVSIFGRQPFLAWARRADTPSSVAQWLEVLLVELPGADGEDGGCVGDLPVRSAHGCPFELGEHGVFGGGQVEVDIERSGRYPASNSLRG